MLLDTDVLIDLVRRHRPAVLWFDQLPKLPGVPGFAAMELQWGCRNSQSLRAIEKFLRAFNVIWPDEVAVSHALSMGDLGLSHNLGLIDALIAATVLGVGEPLATFNVRHYESVPGLIIVQPYTR